MTNNRRTIFRHILTATLLPMVLILGITFLAVDRIVYRFGVNIERETVSILATQVSDRVETVFHSIALQLDVMGRNISNLISSGDIRALASARFLNSFLDSNRSVYNVWFAFEPGVSVTERRFSRSYARKGGGVERVYNVNEDVLANSEMAPWYSGPRESGEPYFDSGGYIDFGDGAGPLYVGILSVPIFSGDKFIGCVGANLLYPRLMNFMDAWQEDDGRSVMLLAEDGMVLYSPDSEGTDRSLADLGFMQDDLDEISEGFAAEDIFIGEVHSPFSNERSLLCVSPISVPGIDGRFFLYMDFPVDSLFTEVDSSVRLLGMIGFAGLLLLVLSVFNATRNVAGPIAGIAKNAEDIASGNFDVEFDDAEVDKADREVQALRESLARMIDELRQHNELRLSVVRSELEKKRLIESSAAKNRFLANVSHEIRTPMNAIVGLAELLLRDPKDEKQAAYARDIKESTESLLEIINDILDLSKMESGAFALVNAHYDFRMMLESLGDSIREGLKSKPLVGFSMSVSKNIPDCLFGDEGRLRQVLFKLLSNALRNTHTGTMDFNVSADEKYLHFAISDSGSRMASGETVGAEGAKLELAVTRYLVAAMDGSIRSEKERHGTTFTVTIPRVEGRREAVVSQAASGTFTASGARALIVDDNEVNLNVAAGLISLYGIECDKAPGGREAIEMVKRADYDIVFMDHMMPEMDGVRTTSIIRAQGGRFATLPIVALTANAVIGASEMFLSSGFDDFMSKPINMARLQSVLLRWIPREKVTLSVAPAASTDDEVPRYSETIAAASKLAELDVRLGLERVAMQQAVYEESLRLTVGKTAQIIAALRAALSNGDLESMYAHAHSAKGSLSGIGAMPLSELAAEIERAADSDDDDFCRRNLPLFIERLARFEDDLGALFPSLQRTPPTTDPGDVSANLGALRDAIAAFDFDACVELLDRIESSLVDKDDAEWIGPLRLLIERFEHEAAMNFIEEIREEYRG